MTTNIVHAIRSAPPRAPYVFISSTMAFGMPQGASRYRRYLVARTPYSADKRFGERLTRTRGLVDRRPTYILRLGEVHGELQNVSREMLLSARQQRLAVRQSTTSSDTVFSSTIALALAHLAQGMDPPGTYTLLESPEWSRRRLFEFYAAQVGVALNVDESGHSEQALVGGAVAAVRGLARSLVAFGVSRISARKDFLTAQFMPFPPAIERRLKAQHLLRRAVAEVQAGREQASSAARYFEGPVPGKRLASLPNTFTATESVRESVAKLLDERIGHESHNFRVRDNQADAPTS